MIKLIGSLLVILACGYTGFSIAHRYQQRPKDLRYLQSALQMLETEISYGATPLPDALETISMRCEKSVALLFKKTREKLLNGGGITAREAWDDAVGQYYRHSNISTSDLTVLKNLGANLGISDREDQVKHLHLAMEQLKIEAAKADDEATKNVKLYNYLGFLSGLTIVIIFI
jgi:stage III sporulation protein AB